MKPISRVTLIAAVVATCLALVSASQTYLSMLDHGHSFARMFVWQLGCWGFWVVVAPLIVRTGEHRGWLRTVILGVALSVAHILVAALITYWLQPYEPISTYGYRLALTVSLPFVWIDPLVYGLLAVGGAAFGAYERARALELRKSQLEVEVARAQFEALRLEIQPHFLFNTLNSIAALIRVRDNDAALTMLVGLSELMRSTLERPAGHLLPLGEEVNLVKRYVDIQRARFGDRLDVSYRIDSGCEEVAVPAFLLQPIVENALRHGLADRVPCHVEIGAAAAEDGSTVRLWVTDDGTGLPPGFDLRRDAGTGLSNATARLRRLYGTAASLTLRQNSPTGTIVELVLPRGHAAPVLA